MSAAGLPRGWRTYRSVPHLYRTPTFYSWRAMLDRCFDPRCKDYPRYGGAGITVFPRWLDLAEFVKDMGLRPSRAHSIDRYPAHQGNYEPGNCRWATAFQQQRNKGNNLKVFFEGREQCLADVCERLGLKYELVHNRLYHGGWSIERALQPSTRAPHSEAVATDRCLSYQQRSRGKRNSTGHRGVERQGDAFLARITVNGKKRYLGRFPTAAAAGAARLEAERRLFAGEPV